MGMGPYLLLAILEGLVQASILCITAAGLSLVFGVMRIVNVAHGEFVMLGAVLAWYAASLVSGHPAAGFLLAILISPLLAAGLALVAERLILKRLDYNPEATIVATIGLLYILQQGVLILYGPDARPVDPPFYYTIRLPWFGYSAYKLSIIGAAVLIMALLWVLQQKTRIGLIMRATQYDRETAQAFGIPVDRVSAGVFALGAGLAALAGVLVVPIQQAHYLMGTDPLLLSFIVVIIGGLGSMLGTVVAAIVIGLSDGILSMMFSPTLAKMVSTMLVALVLIVRPSGLFGKTVR
ncbi:branched-chain amino acid ABC transporter permease [Rhizobium sp. SSA_523]|uniref:branched-chain amino acid ABC transporter permease n=1 Tax=Rhizobium sp. SSA_523 TaxID=2952477 RepID=UPI0020908CCD|nr:branched-chain amino acid ABC transporter permease [Rhizobium sp. SSA_523]MCO5732235.1 branched-chain amino acid ABC transporter permease [Rhizobium sp. SSA_523]WKC21355.1 branched-chain amino acid ABC transporter permease [Rhizobium sp. SSA_523]